MDHFRATTSTGAVVDQPTAIQLADLVAEVDRGGCDASLVVERRADGVTSYLQSRRTTDGWALETRDDDPSHLRQAESTDAALVYSAVAYWVLRTRTWPGLAWHLPRRGPEFAQAV